MPQNQDQYNSYGDITTSAASCTLVNTSGTVVLPLINAHAISSVVITVSGTFSGTLNFAATNAGLPFSTPLALTPIGGGAAVTSATAPGTWTAQIAGLTVVGVYGSPFASGDALVTITSSVAAVSVLSGGSSSASSLTLSPINILSTNTDAIPPHTAATYVITTPGVDAMTIAAPTTGTDDGKVITITSSTTASHTLTFTGGTLRPGTSATTLATFSAGPGSTLSIMAWHAAWYVISQNSIASFA